MRANRADAGSLYDPWEEEPTADAEALAALQARFGGTWRIWRAVDAQRIPGRWCARRINGNGPVVAPSACTADDLAHTLHEVGP